MPVFFLHNPTPFLIKFKTLINPQSPPKSLRFLAHFRFFSSSSLSFSSGSCFTSVNHTKIVVNSTTPMATATPKPPPTIDEGVGIAGKCWIKYRKESTKSLCTPFVVSLAAGDLNLDSFRHYISQDVYFLKAFAQAYARDFFAFFFLFFFSSLCVSCRGFFWLFHRIV